MKVALYIGNHAKDGLSARLGWWIIRLVQRGPFKRVTHCEAIVRGDAALCTIASASLRDGGVRIKKATLTPGNWLIFEIKNVDVARVEKWFQDNSGTPYSTLGAAASALVFLPYATGQFCSKAVAQACGFVGADDMTPAELAEICGTFGRDITAEFFG